MQTLKHKLFSTLHSYRSNQSGQFAIYTAVGIFAILAGLATALDLSNGMSKKQTLQDATDAIALIAVKNSVETQSELDSLAETYIQEHFGDEADNIVIDSIVRSGDVVTVDASNTLDAYVSSVFGKDTLTIKVESSATYAVNDIEIALVLDKTGSMDGEKLETLKIAATDLADTMEAANNSNLRISVVPFASYVNVGLDNETATWIDLDDVARDSWTGCVGSRLNGLDEKAAYDGDEIPGAEYKYEGDSSVRCGAEILALTDDYDDVRDKIDELEADGYTYLPAGLLWGWRTLTSDLPYDEGSESGTDKVIILMSDGANTRSKDGVYHTNKDDDAADDKTEDLCTAAKADDIWIITIAYEITNTDTIELIEGCATEATDFYNAEDSDDLIEAFEDITDRLTEIRITT